MFHIPTSSPPMTSTFGLSGYAMVGALEHRQISSRAAMPRPFGKLMSQSCPSTGRMLMSPATKRCQALLSGS
jgi:hypothetical protein